jgi:hypothetical protein
MRFLRINFLKSTVLSCAILLGSSCTLDLRDDPNALLLSQDQANLLLNSIQRNFALFFNQASTFGMQMTRMQNVGNAQYNTAVRPPDFDAVWGTAYAAVLSDCKLLIERGQAAGYARHVGIARVLQAYTMVTLVDYFGNVPMSQTLLGDANLNPAVDEGGAIYNLAIQTLNTAKVDLTTGLSNNPVPALRGYLSPLATTPSDQYYSNNYAKWLQAINSIKLKIHLQRRLDPALAPALRDSINALRGGVAPVGRGGLITLAGDNLIWRYGVNASDPDARHPRFVNNYPGGGGDYMSNWLMWAMYYGYNFKSELGTGDPRMRFYFYRQVTSNSSDPNEIRCLTETTPSHYPTRGANVGPDGNIFPMGTDPSHPTNDPSNAAWGRTFCFPTPVGYWGRDHVDPQGIPPDGLLRTAWGIYPAGGRYDNNNGASVGSTVGQRGAGFQPIMMRSFVNLMLAEAELYLNADATAAGTRLQSAITASFEDVRDWSVNGTLGTNTMAAATNANAIPAASITAYNAAFPLYLTQVGNAFNASASPSHKMNYIAREAWIAYFGNGIDMYNLYRRTGMPLGLQPAITPQPGIFPRSFWYPATAANLNRNIQQKTDLSLPVFWDKNAPPLKLDF